MGGRREQGKERGREVWGEGKESDKEWREGGNGEGRKGGMKVVGSETGGEKKKVYILYI